MEFECNINNLYEVSTIIAIYKSEYGDNLIECGKVLNHKSVVWKPFNESDFYNNIKKEIEKDLALKKKGNVILRSDPSILFFDEGAKRIIFYTPPGKRLLFFTFFKKGITIPLPGLLFDVHEKNIEVSAFKKKGIPKNDTVFYSVPLPNGSCMGNVKMDIDFSQGEHWVKNQILHLYFDSKFTEENTYHFIKGKITVKEFYEKLSKLNKFPNKLLILKGKPYVRA